MSFFKNNKEIKTENLRLSDFDQIWTKFCFLDETGSLSDRTDQYFTVGILKMSQPYYLQSKLYFERSRARFYVDVKKSFNQNKKRLALAGVCRFDSKSNDLLQFVDLLIGAVTYDIKFKKGLVAGSKYKLELVDYLKGKLGADSFLKGFKNHNFNIFVDKTDHLNTLEIGENSVETNEKGLSS